MAHPVFASIGGNLLVRTGIVAGAILIVTGIATGTLPVRCLAGGSACTARPAATDVAEVAPAPVVKQEPAVTAAAPTKLAVSGDLLSPKPTLTSNDVLAATFAMLPAELQKPTVTAAAKPAGELTTRKVKAISINPDGTPDMSQLVTEAYASSGRTIVPQSPAVEAAARIGAGEQPVAEADLTADKPVVKPAAKPAATAPAPKKAAGGNTGTIAGKGANVRSSPTKGKNQVLFTIPGGATVTLGEKSHGWVKVTDSQGRSGWVYGDYVR